MAFYVGQKVVCVDISHGRRATYLPCPLKVGEVYTIVAFHPVSPSMQVSGDVGTHWACDRFRPVVERKTDISIFTKLLTPNKRAREVV